MAMQRVKRKRRKGKGAKHGQNVLCMPYLIIFDILRSFWAAATAAAATS